MGSAITDLKIYKKQTDNFVATKAPATKVLTDHGNSIL